MSESRFVFVVSCKRIRRSTYSVSFPYNIQLIDRIKNLPKPQRKFNNSNSEWELSALGLYNVMKLYKGSTKIHFDFVDLGTKEVFIKQISKELKKEKEKQELIADLEKKKKHWIKFKEKLETTHEEYIDIVHEHLKPNITLYPHQVIGTMFLNATRNALLALDMGTGKAQPINSKLLTPNGWINMGDIKVGNFVIGSDGKPKKVLGVFPQGIKDIYKVCFNDGTSTECCDEHIWSVNSSLKTLKEIKNNNLYDKSGNINYYIPIVKPIEFKEKNFYIHSYILGCLLGSECLSTKNVTEFNIADADIVNKINNRLPINHILRKNKTNKYSYRIISENQHKNNINDEIRKLNLNNFNSCTKFIPDDYIFSSINQRLELLQGILDTNGYVSKKTGEIELLLTSKQLINDMQFIVQSLGGIGRIKEKWVKYNGENKLYWKINIKLPIEFIPFKLNRKLKLYKQSSKHLLNRGIDSINYVGKKEAQCILIDSEDHLYVTDNCILTHNTIISIAYVEMNNFKKTIVITPNSLKHNYYNEVEKFTDSKAHIINWKKNKYTIEEAKYIIVNYEYFNPKDFNKVKNKFNQLNIGKIDCLIADESHRIKSTKSNSYKNFKKLFKKDIFKNGKISKIFMSGTPAPSKSTELYTVLNQISPIDFVSKSHFYEYYCGMKYNLDGYGWETDFSMTKFEQLYNKIAPYIYRKKKSEVLKDLPEKTYQKIILEMTPKEYEVYYDLEDGVANEFLNKELTNPLSIMGKLKEYTSYLKVNNVKELIDSILESGEKFVAIDFYKNSLYELHKQYPEISALHTGDEKDFERADIIKDFQDENGRIKIFLGSEGTTKEGLTLTAASKVGMLTIPWTPGTLDQCSDRLARIGQKNAVNAYLFIYKDTIDEYILNLIESKRGEISQVIDGEKYESNINQSIINDLIQIIKNKHKK